MRGATPSVMIFNYAFVFERVITAFSSFTTIVSWYIRHGMKGNIDDTRTVAIDGA